MVNQSETETEEESAPNTETDNFDASEAATDLLSEIKEKLEKVPNEKNYKEISVLIDLIPSLTTQPQFETAEVAVNALFCETPKLSLANEITKNLIKSSINRPSSAVWVLVGLLTIVIFAIAFKPFFHSYFIDNIESVDGVKMILDIKLSYFLNVVIFGAIGSVVSIMVRLKDFHKEKNADPIIQVCTGLFKPIIGMAFAVFLLFAIKAKLLPIDPGNADHEVFFFMTLAFLAGFSERLGTDIVSTVESKITTGNKIKDPTES